MFGFRVSPTNGSIGFPKPGIRTTLFGSHIRGTVFGEHAPSALHPSLCACHRTIKSVLL